MKILATPPDAEHVVVDYLDAALLTRGQDVTCATSVPTTWVPGTKPHVLVGHDGTPEVVYPILWKASIRVTAFATSPTDAKALAGLCEALLLSHPGGGGVANILSLTGVLPTRDPDTSAALASISVRVSLRGSVLA